MARAIGRRSANCFYFGMRYVNSSLERQRRLLLFSPIVFCPVGSFFDVEIDFGKCKSARQTLNRINVRLVFSRFG